MFCGFQPDGEEATRPSLVYALRDEFCYSSKQPRRSHRHYDLVVVREMCKEGYDSGVVRIESSVRQYSGHSVQQTTSPQCQ